MAFPQDELCPEVYIQLGDDWVDVSARVRDQIRLRYGGGGEGPSVVPSTVSFELENEDGYLTPDNPTSPYWPYVDIAAPVRVELPTALAGAGSERQLYGEVSAWTPYWRDGVEDNARVAVEAVGILERLTRTGSPLDSPMRRHYLSLPDLVAYLPLEDGADTTVAANLVPGADGAYYGPGPAPEFPRRPGWGRDDSMPGSAPLPDWPAVDYFGWAQGASVVIPSLDSTGAWAIQATIRVPSGSGEVWLAEWRTQGGRFGDWALKVDASGQIEIHGAAGGESSSTFTHTASSLATVDDGAWHAVTVVVEPDGSSQRVTVVTADGSQQFTTASTTVGRLARVRPRPMFADSTDKEPLGLGHLAAFASASGTGEPITALLAGMHAPPVHGWLGESAAGRIVRLGYEENVPVELIHGPQIVDEASGGAAPVTGGTAAASTYEPPAGEVELLTSGSSDTVGAGFGVVVRADPDDTFDACYAAYVVVTEGTGADQPSLYVAVFEGGVEVGSTSAAWTGGEILADTTYHLRVQAVGHLIRLQAWADGDDQPPESQWDLTLVDRSVATGLAGRLRISLTGNASVTSGALEAWDVSSAPVGVQQQAAMVDNAKQASAVDTGILGESRTAAALYYRPSASMYNQAAVMQLVCRADDGGPGQIDASYAPTKDTRGIANDVTVTRQGGGSARVVQETGRRSVQDPPDGVGRWPAEVTLNAASDQHLPGLASWQLHFGVEAGLRLPGLPLDLAWSPELIPTWAGLRLGDRIDLVHVPRQQQVPVRGRVDGWTATMDATNLQVQIAASPYDPWAVGEYGPDSGTADPDEPVRYAPGTESDPGTRVTGGLLLPGAAGDYASTPDAADLDITGDLDLRVEATGEWGTDGIRILAAKWDTDISPGNGSYYLSLNATGQLRLTWSNNGTTFITRVATDLPEELAVGGRLAVRATLDVDDGSSQHVVTFYTAETIDGEWTQLGSPVTTAGTTSIFSGNAPLEAGSRSQGTVQPWTGWIHAVQVYSGIGGLLVADARFDQQATSAATFVDNAGKTWTVHGSGEVLAVFSSGTSTDLAVATTVGPVWTTDADDLPLDINTAGVRLRVIAITTATGAIQVMTVEQQPVNEVEKTISPGEPVALWTPARYAL